MQAIINFHNQTESMEYGSEIWESNKSQANALESIILGELKGFLGILLERVMNQLEVIWVWKHLKAKEIGLS